MAPALFTSEEFATALRLAFAQVGDGTIPHPNKLNAVAKVLARYFGE